jgi:hypothetical protein
VPGSPVIVFETTGEVAMKYIDVRLDKILILTALTKNCPNTKLLVSFTIIMIGVV